MNSPQRTPQAYPGIHNRVPNSCIAPYRKQLLSFIVLFYISPHQLTYIMGYVFSLKIKYAKFRFYNQCKICLIDRMPFTIRCML